MKFSRRRAAAALFGCLALGQAVAQQASPIRVGFIAPLTGPASDFGTSALLGARLAVSEINEVGGFLGRPIELVVKDDTGVPAVGRQHAAALVADDKVGFTIGAGSSGVTLGMLDVFQSSKHLLMVGMATASAITTKFPARDSYIFRMAASDTVQAAFLVDEVVRKGYKRVALFADKTGYGEGGFRDVVRFLQEKGLTPVYVSRFDVGVASLDKEVAEAKAQKADVIVSYTVGPEHALIAKARKSQRADMPQYTPWTGSSRVVWQNGQASANGLVVVQTIVYDNSNERRASFIMRLNRLAAGQPVHSLMAAAQHYDAVHLMLRALFQTKGDASGPALKAALEDLQRPYVGVITTHEKPFSSGDHEAFTSAMAWLGVWESGVIRFLNPEDARRVSYVRRKTASLASPPATTVGQLSEARK